MIDFSTLFSPSSTGIFIGAFMGALIAGIGVGAFYFGGLWLTVRSMTAAQQPALLFIASFVMRTALSIAAIYWIVDGSIVRALACVGGFLVMRIVMIQHWGPSLQGAQKEAQQEVTNLWKPSA